MKIISVARTGFVSTSRTTNLSTGDIATIAGNNVLFNDDDKLNVYLDMVVQGSTSFINGATEKGGTGIGEPEVNLGFYPYATKGAQCAALTTTLDWANDNLAKDYEYIVVTNGFLVSGTLTTTRTDFNNPFDTAKGVVKGCCWPDAHRIGVQPF